MGSASTLAFIVLLVAQSYVSTSSGCDELFEGFGTYLGSVGHFASSPQTVIPKVLEQTYRDLGIRFYRTAFESTFSPTRDVYEIKCENSSSICTFISIHHEIAKFPNISVMASIWSPPHYMKNESTNTLLISEEPNYYHFIKNITVLFKEQFGIDVERVSPVNEPENVFASWEHTNMTPQQLCRMVRDFNDSLISVCPENSYFWISEAYSNTTENADVTCLEVCEIFGTHAYALHIGDDEDNLSAYYDQVKYTRKVPGIPIWQTEVSSTYGRSSERQMEEALDLAFNVANFLGTTCIQRYYFWLSYTKGSSGESLMWGDDHGNLSLPKKYFAYKHYTQAAFGGSKRVTLCNQENMPDVHCIKFNDNNTVFSNKLTLHVPLWDDSVKCNNGSFCCTTSENDWECLQTRTELPPLSVCSCRFM